MLFGIIFMMLIVNMKLELSNVWRVLVDIQLCSLVRMFAKELNRHSHDAEFAETERICIASIWKWSSDR